MLLKLTECSGLRSVEEEGWPKRLEMSQNWSHGSKDFLNWFEVLLPGNRKRRKKTEDNEDTRRQNHGGHIAQTILDMMTKHMCVYVLYVYVLYVYVSYVYVNVYVYVYVYAYVYVYIYICMYQDRYIS